MDRKKESERGFKAFRLFDRPIELYAWKRISIGTRIGGAEAERERKKILEKGCTKPITKQRTPVVKIIYRVKNKLAASSSSGVILSSIGFFHPLGDYPRNSVGFVHAAASIN